MAGCLSVTNSASAPDRCFFSNSPARMRNSAQIPLSSRARAPWRSFFLFAVLQTYAQPLCLPLRHFMTRIKAPTATSKCRLTTSEDAWVVYTSSQLCAFCSGFVTTLFVTERDIQKRSDLAVMHYNNPPLSNGSRQPDYGAPQESHNDTPTNYTPRR